MANEALEQRRQQHRRLVQNVLPDMQDRHSPLWGAFQKAAREMSGDVQQMEHEEWVKRLKDRLRRLFRH